MSPVKFPKNIHTMVLKKINFVEGEKSQYLKMIKKKRPDLWKSANHYPTSYKSDMPFQTYSSPIPEELHRSTWTADNSIKFLEKRNKNKPFYCIVHFGIHTIL